MSSHNDRQKNFRIQRRGRQQERKKTIGLMSKTTSLRVHHAFLYISLPVFAQPRREIAYFRVLWST